MSLAGFFDDCLGFKDRPQLLAFFLMPFLSIVHQPESVMVGQIAAGPIQSASVYCLCFPVAKWQL
jgi:hypothetical protein|tara:strand:- start:818 stop:1012 length:195 start_codon:yes stop_codon:yes gene_type:complete